MGIEPHPESYGIRGITSAALSKKNEATNRFFCPSPPPPFHTPLKAHCMCVQVSFTFSAFEAYALHASTFGPEGEADTRYLAPAYV